MKVRKYQVKPTATPLPIDWSGSGTYTSLWLDAYSVMVSEAERFIVRTSVEAAKRCPNNSQLQEEVRLCSGQEIQHYLAHKTYEDLHLKTKFSFQLVSRSLNFINYKVLEQLLPLKIRLHFVAGLEHMNAMLATLGIKNQILKMDNEATKLYLWHFYEEYEHKDVTFDLLKELGGGYWDRAIVMLILIPLMLFDVTLLSLLFVVQTPSAWTWKNLKAIPSFFFGQNGLGRQLIASSLLYLRKDFSPHNLPALPFKEHYQ